MTLKVQKNLYKCIIQYILEGYFKDGHNKSLITNLLLRKFSYTKFKVPIVLV